MAKPITIKQAVDFPVYALDFTKDNVLIAGGGEGYNQTGVKNHLVSFKVNVETRELIKVDSLLLSEKEDCPMSLACHPNRPLLATGINSMATIIEGGGPNQNCRIFHTDDGKLEIDTTFSTSTSKNTEEYQKVTRFSRSGNYLVTGFSDGKISVLNTTNWQLVFAPIRFKGLQDADFDQDEQHVAVATSTALIILDMADGKPVQVIDSPKLNKTTQCEIRACRFGSFRNSETLYAIVNPISRGRGFICAWKTRKGKPYVTKSITKGISKTSITTFAISPIGNLIAYATTDLGIGLIDAQQLKPLLKVEKAHGFAISSLVFNPSGQLLASGGADDRCKIILLPEFTKNRGFEYIQLTYMVLDMILFALWVHILVQMVDTGVLVF